MYDLQDTIAALASPAGSGARGIIRISGALALDCAARIWSSDLSPSSSVHALRVASRLTGNARFEGLDSPVPCSLFVWPTSRSYTRQTIVEMHTLASPPILQSGLRTVCRHGARLAQPGEFTLRAFLAGRIDLTQAEAVLGIIDSQDRHDLDVATSQLAGGLGRSLTELRDELLDLLAHVEAGLDFVEEDIEFIGQGQLLAQISAAAASVERLSQQTAERAILRDDVRVVLIGTPNAGKSSLFNALLGRTAAVVSPSAGTTRDYVTGSLSIGATQITLIDTAGVASNLDLAADSSQGEVSAFIHRVAQDATTQARRQAVIELLCIDASQPLDGWSRAQLQQARPRIIVLTKVDCPQRQGSIPTAVLTSSQTGYGIEALRARIREIAIERAGSGNVVATTAARCNDTLRAAAVALFRAREMVELRTGEDLVAAELRLAIEELGHVVGAVYTDDLLDRIFSRFCIGK